MSWASFGKALAHIGVGIVKGAVWVSNDPQVVQIAATLAGHPEIGAAIVAGASAVNTASAVVADVKAGDVAGAVVAGQNVIGAVKSLK